MEKFIGFLFWYSLGEPTITQSQLRQHMEDIGMGVSAAPRSILPIDVFRRLTGTSGQYATYTLGDQQVQLDLRQGRETKALLSRQITRTIDGANRIVVGEFVFYHPPRGEPERSRVRITYRNLAELPDKAKVERFGEALREDYRTSLEHLDAQAVRRLVRGYLASRHALLIDKVYFIPDVDTAAHLETLLDRVGGSRSWAIPVHEVSSRLIRNEFITAARQGELPSGMLELYMQIPALQVLPADIVG